MTGFNNAPQALNDTFGTNENQVLQVAAVGVLANDQDVDLPNDTLSVVSQTTMSELGAVVVLSVDGSFSYDPSTLSVLHQLSTGLSAADTFTYLIQGSAGVLIQPAIVTINVEGIDDAPVAQDDAFAIGVGQTAS